MGKEEEQGWGAHRKQEENLVKATALAWAWRTTLVQSEEERIVKRSWAFKVLLLSVDMT